MKLRFRPLMVPPAPSPSRCPRPGHLGNPRRPAPGHKPRDCPRPRGLRASCPGQPRAERAACSRRPRAGWGDSAGDSLDFPRGDLWAGWREGRAGPRRWRRGGEDKARPPHPQTRGEPGCTLSSAGDTLVHHPLPPRAELSPWSSRGGGGGSPERPASRIWNPGSKCFALYLEFLTCLQ